MRHRNASDLEPLQIGLEPSLQAPLHLLQRIVGGEKRVLPCAEHKRGLIEVFFDHTPNNHVISKVIRDGIAHRLCSVDFDRAALDMVDPGRSVENVSPSDEDLSVLRQGDTGLSALEDDLLLGVEPNLLSVDNGVP